MFQKPVTQWEKILEKPLDKQIKFLQKVCKVNRHDDLVIREVFFDNLDFPLIKQIFKLVDRVVAAGGIDPSFQDLIYDRLLRVIGIEHLYPEDRNAEDNIIEGEGYHVYSANYLDLDRIINFINTHDDIKSVCDLGSGSGRALLYMVLETSRDIQYVGLELVEERVEFTNDISKYFGLKNLFFKTSDFLDTPSDFTGFNAYYLYDPVGTDDVDLLISYFVKMIEDGHKFYILFISGWDDLFLDAMAKLERLEKLSSYPSHKQPGRFVNFYQVT